MKKPVTYLGDWFFYLIVVLSAVTFLWVVISPMKYFVGSEIKRMFQNKGEIRALNEYDRLFVQNNITRETFSPQIIIRKKSRELTVYSSDKTIKTYSIGLGRNPTKKKEKFDDQKTPEGNYYICKKIPDHRFHLMLQINYPSIDDARRGVVNHVISTADEIRINQADLEKMDPPADTKLGGSIGIHGYGSESNWTKDGSIALNNNDVEEIYWNIATGCPVIILP